MREKFFQYTTGKCAEKFQFYKFSRKCEIYVNSKWCVFINFAFRKIL